MPPMTDSGSTRRPTLKTGRDTVSGDTVEGVAVVAGPLVGTSAVPGTVFVDGVFVDGVFSDGVFSDVTTELIVAGVMSEPTELTELTPTLSPPLRLLAQRSSTGRWSGQPWAAERWPSRRC